MEFEKHFYKTKFSGFCTSFLQTCLLANFTILAIPSHAKQNQSQSHTQHNSTNSLDNIGGGGAILVKINPQIM